MCVVVDPNNRLPDSNKLNNKVVLPIHIKTKPELAILSTSWILATTANVPPASRTVVLSAKIVNKGEMDAENAVIQFYDHNVKIGEDIVIPHLKYKEEKVVQTYWDMPKGKHSVQVEVGVRSRFEKTHDLLNLGATH